MGQVLNASVQSRPQYSASRLIRDWKFIFGVGVLPHVCENHHRHGFSTAIRCPTRWVLLSKSAFAFMSRNYGSVNEVHTLKFICLEIMDCEAKVLLHTYVSRLRIGERSKYLWIHMSRNYGLWSKGAFECVSKLRIGERNTYLWIHISKSRTVKQKCFCIHLSRNYGSVNEVHTFEFICLEITDCEAKVLLHSYVSKLRIGKRSTYLRIHMSWNHGLWSKSALTFICLEITDRWTKYVPSNSYVSKSRTPSALTFMSRNHGL
jgi:hypothetical protein